MPAHLDTTTMFDTTDRILNQLRAGEDGLAEFEALRLGDRGVLPPNNEDPAGELVAFANADGGTIFLGVDDSGAVAGIPPARLDAVERWIVNIASHNCEPPIRRFCARIVLPASTGEERHVLLAEVPRGLYVHRTSGGRYYLRVGSTRRDLTPPELARLFQQRGREYVFDEQPVLAATVDHLNRHRLEAFFGRSPTIPWLDLLRNTRVTLRDEGGVDRPTVAGLLTFGTEPTEFLASGSIEAACYSGERLSSDNLVHAERLAGRAPDQIDAAVAFAAQLMRHPTHGRPAGSSDPPYDLDVVDEAVVNAIAHRDYAISGSKIRLSCSPTGSRSAAPAGCPTASRSTRCPTARSPATSSWSASSRASAASAPTGCSSNREPKACGRSSGTARRIPAGGPSTSCSATSSG